MDAVAHGDSVFIFCVVLFDVELRGRVGAVLGGGVGGDQVEQKQVHEKKKDGRIQTTIATLHTRSLGRLEAE